MLGVVLILYRLLVELALARIEFADAVSFMDHVIRFAYGGEVTLPLVADYKCLILFVKGVFVTARSTQFLGSEKCFEVAVEIAGRPSPNHLFEEEDQTSMS